MPSIARSHNRLPIGSITSMYGMVTAKYAWLRKLQSTPDAK